MSITTKSELKHHATKVCKSHYFERGAMQFFRSRLESVHPGKGATYFVTSEQFDDQSPRKCSVRKLKNCKIDTVGEFNVMSCADAKAKAKALAKGGSELGGARRRRRRR